MNGDLAKLGNDATYKERLASLGAEPAQPASPSEVGAFIGNEIKRWAKVVKQGNIRAE